MISLFVSTRGGGDKLLQFSKFEVSEHPRRMKHRYATGFNQTL